MLTAVDRDYVDGASNRCWAADFMSLLSFGPVLKRDVRIVACTSAPGSAALACVTTPTVALDTAARIEADLLARRARAEQAGRLGEIEDIDLTLSFLRQKREESQRLALLAPVNLGMPVLRPQGRAPLTAHHRWSLVGPRASA
ncbi:hypothetical protein [Streptomyces sp. NPDC052042]|uniref:hypothetical protein n=1 Tax=Streptomyces sp. NPDC052042 TaxID=3365683 RepID=UPI0037D14832